MILFFSLVCLVLSFVSFGTQSYCIFKIGEYQFDLSDIKEPIEGGYCRDSYRSIHFNLCENLKPSECTADSSGNHSTTNACEVYTRTPEEYDWWVGSPSNKFVEYGKTYKDNKYQIIYHGTKETGVDVEITATCDPTEKNVNVTNCQIIFSKSLNIFKVDISSLHMCPKKKRRDVM